MFRNIYVLPLLVFSSLVILADTPSALTQTQEAQVTQKLQQAKQAVDRVAQSTGKLSSVQRKALSGAALNLIHLSQNWSRLEPKLRQAMLKAQAGITPQFSRGSTVRVSNPATDTSTVQGFTQNETSTARCGNTVVSAFNDSGSFVETGGLSFNGYARSTDGGLTFKDLKFVPAPAPGFLQGDPVVQCASANTFYQSSLFDDGRASTISVSKSTNGGQTFNAPVVAALYVERRWQTDPAWDSGSPRSDYILVAAVSTAKRGVIMSRLKSLPEGSG